MFVHGVWTQAVFPLGVRCSRQFYRPVTSCCHVPSGSRLIYQRAASDKVHFTDCFMRMAKLACSDSLTQAA